MTKLQNSLAAGAALALGFAAAAIPAQAQTQGTGRVEVIVYGDDPCPRAAEDEVVVCVKRPEAERYRIPENYRPGGPRQARTAWTVKARELEQVSDTGIQSCSAVGPGGHTGCLEQAIRQNEAQAQEAAQQDTPPE